MLTVLTQQVAQTGYFLIAHVLRRQAGNHSLHGFANMEDLDQLTTAEGDDACAHIRTPDHQARHACSRPIASRSVPRLMP